MRWDNLTIEAEQEDTARLPGYAEQAVVRRFDAPEALDTRFYEVRAKSALNKVPEKSRMPFRWTVNPYRGCSHACSYCSRWDTPVLLSDGGSRAIADLRIGDRIVGTVPVGRRRRFVETTVLDHWTVSKPAFRVRLTDGSEIVTSGDHRLLTPSGWKHVTSGGTARPRLETGDALVSLVVQAAGGSVLVQDRALPLASRDDRRVLSIEPTGGDELLYDITTGTGDFIANGVVSHNCFARPTHTYLDLDAGRDFEKEIVVKVNVGEVLARQLRRPSWGREHVALGTNTDPYQWVESKYRLMREIWAAMRDTANPCSILTKSPLVLRDLDLLKEIAAVTSISANLSVPTIDREAWRASEPHTPSPRARLEAVGELNRAGIPCGVLVAPLMPGINDDPRQVEEILTLAAENGATRVGGIALHLRGETRGVFMDWLRSYRPDLVERYERLYARSAYAPPPERQRLAALLRGGPVMPDRGPDDFQLPPSDLRGVRREVEEAEAAVDRPTPRFDRRPPQEALF